MEDIPIEYQLKCNGCGKILDMRDVNVLSHGWIENGKIVCYDEIDLPYSSSRKIGEPVQWTNDKKPIHLS